MVRFKCFIWFIIYRVNGETSRTNIKDSIVSFKIHYFKWRFFEKINLRASEAHLISGLDEKYIILMILWFWLYPFYLCVETIVVERFFRLDHPIESSNSKHIDLNFTLSVNFMIGIVSGNTWIHLIQVKLIS